MTFPHQIDTINKEMEIIKKDTNGNSGMEKYNGQN